MYSYIEYFQMNLKKSDVKLRKFLKSSQNVRRLGEGAGSNPLLDPRMMKKQLHIYVGVYNVKNVHL